MTLSWNYRTMWTLLILPIFLHMGCGQQVPSISLPRVIDGKTEAQNPYPLVALLKPDSQGIYFAFCGGTLVSPHHLVTAAHCSKSADGDVDFVKSVRVVPRTAKPEDESALRLNVAEIFIHPLFDPIKMRSDEDGIVKPWDAHDIAVWRLQGDVPAGAVADLTPAETIDPLLVDLRPVTIIGFGRQSTWESPYEPHILSRAVTPYFKEVSMNVVKKVHMDDGRLLTRRVTVRFPGRSPTEFFAGGTGYPDTCKGDSGSGAYLQSSDGSLIFAGVTSRGNSSCGKGGIYTMVSAYIDWIKDKMVNGSGAS